MRIVLYITASGLLTEDLKAMEIEGGVCFPGNDKEGVRSLPVRVSSRRFKPGDKVSVVIRGFKAPGYWEMKVTRVFPVELSA